MVRRKKVPRVVFDTESPMWNLSCWQSPLRKLSQSRHLRASKELAAPMLSMKYLKIKHISDQVLTHTRLAIVEYLIGTEVGALVVKAPVVLATRPEARQR